jgi:cell division protein FtsQ
MSARKNAQRELLHRAPRYRRRKRLGIALTLVAGLAGAAWLLGWSSIMTVTAVSVEGIAPGSPLQQSEIIELSGVRVGDPIARVSTPAIRRELVKISRIEKVSVERNLAREVRLVIIERTPVAIARISGESLLVDAQGRSFAIAGSQTVGLLVIELSRRDEEVLRSAINVLMNMTPQLRESVTAMKAKSVDDITFTLERPNKGALRILWGSQDEGELKERVLETLLRKSGAGSWVQVDVSAPRAPTTRE